MGVQLFTDLEGLYNSFFTQASRLGNYVLHPILVFEDSRIHQTHYRILY